MWRPEIILKNKTHTRTKSKNNAFGQKPIFGTAGVRAEKIKMKIAAQTTGKAPVNSGTVTTVLSDGCTDVLESCPFSSSFEWWTFWQLYTTFFVSSVWGTEDGKPASSMFTRVPKGGRGPKGGDSAKVPFQWHCSSDPLPYTSKSFLNCTDAKER